MAYLISALVAAAGVVVLIALLLRLAGSIRGIARTARASEARLADRRGLLTARIAALRVELAQRRRRGTAETSTAPRPRSIDSAQEARRPTMSIPTGWELVLLLGVLVLLFGATKLPTAARSIGQSMRIFKAETKGMRSEDEATSQAPRQQSPQQTLPPSGPAATPVEEPQRHNDTTR